MPGHGLIWTTLNAMQVTTDQKVAVSSTRDIRGMSAATEIEAVTSALVRRSALARAVMACKTVGPTGLQQLTAATRNCPETAM